MQIHRCLVTVMAIVVSSVVASCDEQPIPTASTEPFLTVRLIDEDGIPVADADAGFAYVRNQRLREDWLYVCGVKSGEDGLAKFHNGKEKAKRWGLYARHADRHLVAIHETATADPGTILTLRMQPECDVRYRVTCRQLDSLGRLPRYIGSGMAMSDRSVNKQSFIQDLFGTVGAEQHAYLPSGKFILRIGGEYLEEVEKQIEISSGQRKLNLDDIDLIATRMALLIGQPAPELPDIAEWKNGPPQFLRQLRGKVVLLEFWGYWCGGCVQDAIPEIFKLQEEFQHTEMVILGIHVDTDANEADTVEKLDQKLARFRTRYWKGRDISFPVALIPGAQNRDDLEIKQEPMTDLAADYGITGYPTTVLINQEGKVVGSFYLTLEDDKARLREQLSQLIKAPNIADQ